MDHERREDARQNVTRIYREELPRRVPKPSATSSRCAPGRGSLRGGSRSRSRRESRLTL